MSEKKPNKTERANINESNPRHRSEPKDKRKPKH